MSALEHVSNNYSTINTNFVPVAHILLMLPFVTNMMSIGSFKESSKRKLK